MSPRNKIPRRISNNPIIEGFVPNTMGRESFYKEPIVLFLEEYEAIRLCDYEGLTQMEASECMGVSRPTFTRVYSHALRKVAKAFVEGRPLQFSIGAAFFESDWYNCRECGCHFSNVTRSIPPVECPVCGSNR